MDSSIALDLSDPSDTEAEKVIPETLQDLVNGQVDSSTAARRIDAIIVTECQNAYKTYISRPELLPRPEDDTVRGPEPTGWLHYLWHCLGRTAMKIPSDHPAQDRIVQLLRELQMLPRKKLPALGGGKLYEKELWNLTAANRYDGLEQLLCELDEGKLHGWRQVESSQSAAASYLNFSAFLARLLSAEVAEVTKLSALIRPPFVGSTFLKHPDGKYDPYASAAAQWIFSAGAALFEMCEKNTLVEMTGQNWTRTLWQNWKATFAAVADSPKFGRQARDFSARAAKLMAEIEVRGVTTHVVESFGFMLVLDEDEDEDEDE